jgi:hypothetical protein
MVLDWTDAPPTLVTSMSDHQSKSNRLLMRVLGTIIVDHSVSHTPFADGPTVRAVKIELVAAEYIRQYPTGLPDSKRRQFDRAIRTAQNSGQIASRADELGHQWVWRS